MPELPDVVGYIEALRTRIEGHTLEKIHILKPFLVRSFDPPIQSAVGKKVIGLRRLGKRIVWDLEDDLFIVIHLMIAGRFQWKEGAANPPGKLGLAHFVFPSGFLILTEAGTKKRASLYLVKGEEALAGHQPGGLEVLESDLKGFIAQIRKENHTLKRTLTDPKLFSGIGNAFSGEILHHARLSPVKLSQKLTEEEIQRLFESSREVLHSWSETLIDRYKKKFPGPGEVTAFRPEFAVHGKFEHPCPVCGTPVQRIRYADNETNYCPTCQTEGKLLADRAMSRLLKRDWPKSLEEFSEKYGIDTD
ncbi:MAG: formamidopyrimidine-DNA glycosylase [Candidatus Omnitrophica bacterium]|nr:formamidopyrimidine-DNA glycosylase [Candidatus Omnitrophota bacterium]